MPAHTTLGSLGDTATAPTEPVPNAESASDTHERPASVVRHTPPPVAPM